MDVLLRRSLISNSLIFCLALCLVPFLANAQQLSFEKQPGNVSKDTPRPNILLIVADDLGYGDLGSYGSHIATPNIDQLASTGVLYTQFHTAPMCAPTRAMLFSGNNNHVAGMARQSTSGILGDPHPGYEAHLSERVAPFPGLLRDAGYHTYITGKWHLGLAPEHSPTAAGFERSYCMLDGAGSHWNATGFEEGGSTYWRDGAFSVWPDNSYSTEVYTDQMIEFIDSNLADGKPFFGMVSYTSPHWPLQVPEEDLHLYAGRYDAGYDRLRERRFETLKAAGVIPGESTLPPRNESIAPWESLDVDKQRREARKMELYAAMVHNLDEHIGRLLAHLKDQGVYENTVIVFMADNGTAGEDFYNGIPQAYMGYVRDHYDNRYENMGRPGSFVSYGAPWAEAGSAPFSRFKVSAREGGITAPMIISGTGVSSRGVIDRNYLTVMDLAPTFLELAATSYPQRLGLEPMLGASMVSLLQGKANAVHAETYVTAISHMGRAFVRRGNWKLVNLNVPFDEAEMELFNLKTDPGETTDLAATEPGIYQEMLELWRSERRRLGIVLPQDL